MRGMGLNVVNTLLVISAFSMSSCSNSGTKSQTADDPMHQAKNKIENLVSPEKACVQRVVDDFEKVKDGSERYVEVMDDLTGNKTPMNAYNALQQLVNLYGIINVDGCPTSIRVAYSNHVSALNEWKSFISGLPQDQPISSLGDVASQPNVNPKETADDLDSAILDAKLKIR